ncbi:hypothetical protein D3C77_816160 [compost metagenome]
MRQGDWLALEAGDGLGAEHLIGIALDGDQATRSALNQRAVFVHQFALVVEQRAGTSDWNVFAQ